MRDDRCKCLSLHIFTRYQIFFYLFIAVWLSFFVHFRYFKCHFDIFGWKETHHSEMESSIRENLYIFLIIFQSSQPTMPGRMNVSVVPWPFLEPWAPGFWVAAKGGNFSSFFGLSAANIYRTITKFLDHFGIPPNQDRFLKAPIARGSCVLNPHELNVI